MATRGRDDAQEVHRISSAPRSLSDDVRTRTRRYLWSMAVRTLCFLGCVLAFVVLKNAILGWILFVGALILPYLAVVIANGGRERTPQIPLSTLLEGRQQLGGTTDAAPGGGADNSSP
ncbi:MAG TPA: DUF3099 domain-containing protein [Actinobacteria bacterium]|nr:DUF3099 domain-containing protein [Actinomycetota bacterium]HCK79432.1 DUF3099 domain-containing protein [Actinomycetota bacterium]